MIGQSEPRKESWSKVTGAAVYTDDLPVTGCLTARLVVSPCCHARIAGKDIRAAAQLPGVLAVVTGDDFPALCGNLICDRPPLARDVVRYCGEPVAIVVATDEATASRAAALVQISYATLPAVFSPREALEPDAPVLHPGLGGYARPASDVSPQPGGNINSMYRIRKGNITEGWVASDVTVSQSYALPPSDHVAMEVRSARAEIFKDGTVEITTASQSPFEVANQLSSCFGVAPGDIRVRVPFVGGGFGGKAPVTLEILAYMASRRVGGKAVRLIITREQDMTSAPCRMGLEAEIKIGAASNGLIQAAELTFWLDNGAYADIGPYMAKAIAADCTGPYNIPNLTCDVLSVYTNHTYVTSFRGFAHESYTFCIERALDTLAARCGIDPLALRRLNALKPGQASPTGIVATTGNLGDVTSCIDRLEELAGKENMASGPAGGHTVRGRGVACFWKMAVPPTDAGSGALISFNRDGSANLNTGVVEMGSGGQSQLAQMLAEKLGLTVDQVHVEMGVDTRLSPEHYKTVASMTNYIAGRAVMRAADDLLDQLRGIGAQALACGPEDIEVGGGRVYARHDPAAYLELKDVVSGYKAPDGQSHGDPVLGRGAVIFKGLSQLDPLTGRGKPGPAWTVGAQCVEVELDRRDYTYKIIRAATVVDAGCVTNPKAMEESVRGGMAMGLSMASRECFSYDGQGLVTTPSLRTYKLLHIGQEPEYRVAFVETPQPDSPYGTRSISEHGIIGMPAALANALSDAAGINIRSLPLTPERLWRDATI